MNRALDHVARELVDPSLFATLEDLGLIARTAVEGFLEGLHRSPYVGFSVEFASHREYLRGDDLRHLNWKVFGRQERLYIKQYDAETNLDLHLLVDWSGSMTTHSGLGTPPPAPPRSGEGSSRASGSPLRFGEGRGGGVSSGTLSKHRYASCLAAALAHLALHQRDAAGLTLFADGILDHLKPRAKSNQLDAALQSLTRTPLRPRADSAGVLHEVASLMPRRGLVVLISDLFYDMAEVFSGLDHFRFQGHDVLLFHILDPLERWLPVEGAIRFHDLETGEELVAQAEDIRPAYQASLQEWFDEVEQGCRARGIERVALTTDQPLAQALYDYLARRAQHY